jgi:hypothetical protein
MKTGTVKYRNMLYELYHPNGELLATTNSMARNFTLSSQVWLDEVTSFILKK